MEAVRLARKGNGRPPPCLTHAWGADQSLLKKGQPREDGSTGKKFINDRTTIKEVGEEKGRQGRKSAASRKMEGKGEIPTIQFG